MRQTTEPIAAFTAALPLHLGLSAVVVASHTVLIWWSPTLPLWRKILLLGVVSFGGRLLLHQLQDQGIAQKHGAQAITALVLTAFAAFVSERNGMEFSIACDVWSFYMISQAVACALLPLFLMTCTCLWDRTHRVIPGL